MATSSKSNNPLSKLIRGPLVKISEQISEMMDCAYKIEQLEKLAVANPSYETLTARIKRANDFAALQKSIAINKLEIDRIFQIMNEKVKDDRKLLYDQLEMEYEKFSKNLLASSDQITHIDKDYLEREYLEKLQNLLSQVDTLIKLLSDNVHMFDVRIKEINNEIKQLTIEIEEDKSNLITMIDKLCDMNNTTPDIETVIINMPVFNETGEVIVSAEESEESVEFLFDNNSDKHILGKYLQTAIQSGMIDKESLIDQLENHLHNTVIDQAHSHFIHLNWTRKNISDFILKLPEIVQLTKNRAKNTYENLENSKLYSNFFNDLKSLKEKEQNLECKIKEVEELTNARELCVSNIEKLSAISTDGDLALDYLRNPTENTLDVLQKTIQTSYNTLDNAEESNQVNTTQLEIEKDKPQDDDIPTPKR